MVIPRFIPTCSPKLLSRLGQIAQHYQCHITSHISESIDEVTFSKSLDPQGRSDTMIFEEHNLLSNKCIMAHGVHLSETDLEMLQQYGTAIAHCPLSNFYFAGGILSCRQLMTQNK